MNYDLIISSSTSGNYVKPIAASTLERLSGLSLSYKKPEYITIMADTGTIYRFEKDRHYAEYMKYIDLVNRKNNERF